MHWFLIETNIYTTNVHGWPCPFTFLCTCCQECIRTLMHSWCCVWDQKLIAVKSSPDEKCRVHRGDYPFRELYHSYQTHDCMRLYVVLSSNYLATYTMIMCISGISCTCTHDSVQGWPSHSRRGRRWWLLHHLRSPPARREGYHQPGHTTQRPPSHLLDVNKGWYRNVKLIARCYCYVLYHYKTGKGSLDNYLDGKARLQRYSHFQAFYSFSTV